jgi:acyl carrier protein
MLGNQSSASSASSASAASSAPLVRTIGKLIAEQLLVEVGSLEDDLLATGVLDSLTLIELLVNLEEHFGMRIPLDELQIEDIRSVRSIARLVESKRPVRSQAMEVGLQTT